MARLKLVKGDATRNEFILNAAEEVIGRDPGQASIVLNDQSAAISRSHASIFCDGDACFIQDHSKSGTSLNGHRLDRDQRYRLDENDVIQLCNYVLRFRNDDEPSGDSVQISDESSSSLSRFLDLSSNSRRLRKDTNAESKLSAIIELTQNLRSCKSLESLLGTALDTLLKLFPQAYRGAVAILEPESQQPISSVVRYRMGEEEETAIFGTSVIQSIATRRAAGLSENGEMICAPLLDEDELAFGVVFLDSRIADGGFRTDELDILATVSAELAIFIENRLLQEVALKNQELQFELQVANEVQIKLLPAEPPAMQEYEFFDYYAPARQVGGDYFDYIDLENHRLAVVLGDVAGKGIPAALLMSKVANELSILLTTGFGVTDAMHRVNARLANRNPRGSFVTMVLAVLDHTHDELVLVNAGHCSPLLRRADGGVAEVGRQQSGFPLGIDPHQQYAEMRLEMCCGETLVVYSDGVTDAQNSLGESYGEHRLRTLLARGSQSAQALGEQIMHDIHSFVGDEEQFDDICLLCVRRTSDDHPLNE